MKVGNPDQMVAEAIGKTPDGWYDIPTILGVVQGFYPDLVRIDRMDQEGQRRMTSEVKRAEHHPWRYVVDRVGGEVRIRALKQEVRVPETQPARLGSRAWEADPEGFFDPEEDDVYDHRGAAEQPSLIPGTHIVSGTEHDPNL